MSTFDHGPYTTIGTLAPEEPTREPMSKPFKVTLLVVAALLFAIGCLAGATMRNGVADRPAKSESIEQCVEEDGSTQELCVFRGTNGNIINMDYGHYSFNVSNATLDTYSTER